MAKEIVGRQHIGKIPDNPLQELPDFVDYGEDPSKLAEATFPVWLPAVRGDKPNRLRKLNVDDLAKFIPENDLYGIESVSSYYAIAEAWTKPEAIGEEKWTEEIPEEVASGSWIYCKVVILLRNGQDFVHYFLTGVNRALTSENNTLKIVESASEVDLAVNMALEKFEFLRDMHVPILEECPSGDLC
jgi:hypothetical protein